MAEIPRAAEIFENLRYYHFSSGRAGKLKSNLKQVIERQVLINKYGIGVISCLFTFTHTLFKSHSRCLHRNLQTVDHLGVQEDGTFVFESDFQVDKEGQVLPPEE